jgi:hypothetical protein
VVQFLFFREVLIVTRRANHKLFSARREALDWLAENEPKERSPGMSKREMLQ